MEDICFRAISGDNLSLLIFLHTEGKLKYTEDLSIISAHFGNIRILRWLRKKGYPWSNRTCASAALNNQLTTLIWLHQEGCPCSSMTGIIASNKGHLDILKWELLNCSHNIWDYYIEAAENGHLNIIKWLDSRCYIENNEFTIPFAIKGGNLSIIKWMKERGYQWNIMCIIYAEKVGKKDVLQYIHNADLTICNTKCPYCLVNEIRNLSNNYIEWIPLEIIEDILESVL